MPPTRFRAQVRRPSRREQRAAVLRVDAPVRCDNAAVLLWSNVASGFDRDMLRSGYKEWTMYRRASPRNGNLRRALAQEAARIMAQHGIHDFLTAKRKAAERLGVTDSSALPRNTEIEEALAEYQRLFDAGRPRADPQAQRRAALQAMHWLSQFEPRLVGPVLTRHRHRARRHPAASVRRYARVRGAASSLIAALRTKSPSGACASMPSASRPIPDCDSRSTTAEIEATVFPAGRHSPGAGQPGRRPPDAAGRRRRDRKLLEDAQRPHAACAARPARNRVASGPV